MPGEEYQHAQAAAGPTMLFVTLRPTQANGAPWDKAAFNELANEWREVRRARVRTRATDAHTPPVGRSAAATAAAYL